jgi:hypothetical protein
LGNQLPGRLRAAQRHQPLIQFQVNPPQLAVAGDVVGGQTEGQQDAYQDETVPGLETPADGINNHQGAGTL